MNARLKKAVERRRAEARALDLTPIPPLPLPAPEPAPELGELDQGDLDHLAESVADDEG